MPRITKADLEAKIKDLAHALDSSRNETSFWKRELEFHKTLSFERKQVMDKALDIAHFRAKEGH